MFFTIIIFIWIVTEKTIVYLIIKNKLLINTGCQSLLMLKQVNKNKYFWKKSNNTFIFFYLNKI